MKKFFLVVAFAVMSTVLSSCTYIVPELSCSQAEELAHTYFADTYGKNAEVRFWNRVQVMEDMSVWCIYVTIDGEEYELILDENDDPLADNYVCLNRIREIECVASFQLSNGTVSLSAVLNYENRAYRIVCEVGINQLLTQEQGEEFFSLLRYLKGYDVERMVIAVSSPELLLSEPERNLGTHGYCLCAEWFYTDLEKIDFDKQYLTFINRFFWDEQAFSDKAELLAALGCREVDFYISDFKVDSIVVSVYCEIGAEENVTITDEIVSLSEAAFRIDGKSIRYKANIQSVS